MTDQEVFRPIQPGNCALRMYTGDGAPVGRCWHWLGGTDTCPTHGDVKEAMERYRSTGKLIDEPPRGERL